ncbi:MAG: VWA domain-containing protein, partial [Candidatus Binataceae bacterium]
MPAEITTKLNYAQATAIVVRPSGFKMETLTQSDFVVVQNNQPRPIVFFRANERAPVSIGLLVDSSGSMATKLPAARTAVGEFIKRLNQRDDLFLIAFASQLSLLQGLTTDHDLAVKRLNLLKAYGQTALFDAIVAATTLMK